MERTQRTLTVRINDRLDDTRHYPVDLLPDGMPVGTVRIRVVTATADPRRQWDKLVKKARQAGTLQVTVVETTGEDDERGLYAGRDQSHPYSTTYELKGDFPALDVMVPYKLPKWILSVQDRTDRKIYGASGAGEAPRRVRTDSPVYTERGNAIDRGGYSRRI